MKAINLIFTLSIFLCVTAVAQDSIVPSIENEAARVEDKEYNDTLAQTDGQSDSLEIKIRNKSIVIDDERVTIGDDKKEKYYSYEKKKKKRRNFSGHLEGLEIGMANFVDENYEMSRIPEESFMDLNTGRSHVITIYPGDKSFKLLTSRFGLVTSVGFSWANYHFDNNNTIIKNPLTGNIEGLYENNITYDKTKLTVGCINVPLLLELQPFGTSQRAFISAGIIGELKLFSSTKQVYRNNSDKQKEKERGDFNINPIRYALTARAGYDDFGIFLNYYPVMMFEKSKGPELYPVMIGVALSLD